MMFAIFSKTMRIEYKKNNMFVVNFARLYCSLSVIYDCCVKYVKVKINYFDIGCHYFLYICKIK